MGYLHSETNMGQPEIRSAHDPAPITDGTRWLAPDPTSHELPLGIRTVVCHLLNQSLVDCIDLERRCVHARLNSRGPDADTLAPWLDEAAGIAARYAQRIAARITRLDGTAQATPEALARRSGLSEHPLPAEDSAGDAATVTTALAIVASALREDMDRLAGYGDSTSQHILDAAAHALARVAKG